jgi:hypothetical protein
MSDVIELYDDAVSEFYYVDRKVLRKIGFEPQEQAQNMDMKM